MTSYQLQLNIDMETLRYIKAAQQRITLARTVSSSEPSVVWLTFDPFAANMIEWAEDFWLYASNTQMTSGASILKLSELTPGPALDAGYYPFTAAAVFNQFVGSSDIPQGSFAINNDMPPSSYPALTFGLSQTANVNGQVTERKVISAQMVLANQTLLLTPTTRVYVWLQSQFTSGTAIGKIIGKYTVATFGGGVSEISMTYDPNRGIFVPSNAALSDQGNVLHVEPAII
ncbi:hypothetical protein [Roseibium sp. Sym1]|uniref:hypothetical protein n=1 Tax=Roseibium sp. Sym1 TaxID=3016006 RepID=UPI0022B50859|nr:hypothetical protein [Roseibium sp. Sym1]